MTYVECKAYADRAILLLTRTEYTTFNNLGVAVILEEHWSVSNLAILGTAIQVAIDRLTACETPEGKAAEKAALITQLNSLL
jgi:hypothetical protein